MKFFDVFFPQSSIYGIGYPDYDFSVPNSGKIIDWQTPIIRLKDGPFSDYQGCLPLCRLCSKKFREIIDQNASPSDEIQWLPVNAIDEQGEHREYFIIHFPVIYDVLDKSRSIYANHTHIVKPVLSLKKIGDHKVFNFNPIGFLTFVISEDVKTEIEKADLTNIVIEKASVVN